MSFFLNHHAKDDYVEIAFLGHLSLNFHTKSDILRAKYKHCKVGSTKNATKDGSLLRLIFDLGDNFSSVNASISHAYASSSLPQGRSVIH